MKSRPVLTLKAPAKVNLFLDVKRKRPDGFHGLLTVFERIRLWDTLKFWPARSAIAFHCCEKGIPKGSGNLVVKAARLLKSRYSVGKGVVIELEKKIPVGAGLGGGSSDAASTLMGLNRVWNLHLNRKELLRHALELGSDVPFFILKTPYAVGQGRGEKLRILKSTRRIWHVLVTPEIRILTRNVYNAWNPFYKTARTPDVRSLTSNLRDSRSGFLNALLYNRLEELVLYKFPILATIKRNLIKAGARTALISGSGSTVFGIAGSCSSAQRIARTLKREHPGAKIFVASTMI